MDLAVENEKLKLEISELKLENQRLKTEVVETEERRQRTLQIAKDMLQAMKNVSGDTNKLNAKT